MNIVRKVLKLSGGAKLRKLCKIVFIIFSTISIFLLLFVSVLGVIIHKTMEKELNQDLPFFQSMKMVLALNYDSEKEIQVKEDRTREQYRQISVYYPDDFTELMPLTKETLDWAIDKNEELFGKVKEVPIDFIIFDNYDELEELSGLMDISGYYSDFDKIMAIIYDNKESILEKYETSLYFFQKSILHEYTHYILARLTNNSSKGISSYPIWFLEGICEYVGNDKTNVDYQGFNFKFTPLVELNTPNQWQTARLQDDTDVYLQSYFIIEYLVDTFGTGIMKEVINETNRTGNFEEGFLKATELTIERFENNFLDVYEMAR